MIFNIEFWYMEKYLPTKRHRKLRERYVKSSIDVEIKELTENEFPIAFKIHDYKTVCEDMKTYEDYYACKNEYKMHTEEMRTYNNELFMPIRITHGTAISTCFAPLNHITEELKGYKPFYYEYKEDFTDLSIIKQTNRKEEVSFINKKAEAYLIFDNKIWKRCGEPMYNIVTFGLGYNHGGTAFFIVYAYDNNEYYFNALERDEAIKYGKEIALNRGDTNDVDRIGKFDNIEVLMPEMVKRNRIKEC